MAMDRRHLPTRRNAPATDGPDRLIGDDGRRCARPRWQAAVELAGDHVDSLASLPFIFGFANTDDGDETRAQCGVGLALDNAVGFAMSGAALRVADDDVAA